MPLPPGPWTVEYGEHSGYDCMTAGFVIKDKTGAEVVTIDLRHYGQESCEDPSTETRARAEAVARLFIAVPALLAALEANMSAMAQAINDTDEAPRWLTPAFEMTRAVIAKAKGEGA